MIRDGVNAGLGDIVLPGLLVALSARADAVAACGMYDVAVTMVYSPCTLAHHTSDVVRPTSPRRRRPRSTAFLIVVFSALVCNNASHVNNTYSLAFHPSPTRYFAHTIAGYAVGLALAMTIAR